MAWTINGSVEGGDLDIFASDYRVCMIDCDNDSVSNHDHETNAQLIAAAPDLLAALEAAAEQLRTLLDESLDEDYSVLTSAETAIAKAKGEA
jgi:hypothetical protein